MQYLRTIFPLFVYACIDTASRKAISLRIWTDNCDHKRIVRWYFNYLFQKRIDLARLRIDKGSETGDMATIHTFLINSHAGEEGPSEGVIFGKSTANQIERWKRELHDFFFFFLHEDNLKNKLCIYSSKVFMTQTF